MTYRTYIRTFDGNISEKTITKDQNVAAEAFAALVGRIELDGQKLAAALTYNNRQLAFHRFDRRPGDRDYWRDKMHEIEWTEEDAPAKVGRPATMESPREIRLYLPLADIEFLESVGKKAGEINHKTGKGNVSAGVRELIKKSVGVK